MSWHPGDHVEQRARAAMATVTEVLVNKFHLERKRIHRECLAVDRGDEIPSRIDALSAQLLRNSSRQIVLTLAALLAESGEALSAETRQWIHRTAGRQIDLLAAGLGEQLRSLRLKLDAWGADHARIPRAVEQARDERTRQLEQLVP